MKKQTKNIIVGCLGILLSWFFATQVGDSNMGMWYAAASVFTGFPSLMIVFFSAIESF